MSAVLVVATACGSGEDADAVLDVGVCLDVTAEGSTEGTIARLRGHGVFRFGEEEREALVGLYFFDFEDGPDGGRRANAQYQFVWDNGDSFLTADNVFMERTLKPDEYSFNVAMTVVAGAGQFAGMEGTRPLSLDALLTFGPPKEPGDLPTLSEKFTIAGKLCGS